MRIPERFIPRRIRRRRVHRALSWYDQRPARTLRRDISSYGAGER